VEQERNGVRLFQLFTRTAFLLHVCLNVHRSLLFVCLLNCMVLSCSSLLLCGIVSVFGIVLERLVVAV